MKIKKINKQFEIKHASQLLKRILKNFIDKEKPDQKRLKFLRQE